ncbi:hypothetical protein, partial [Rathayibacter toxicus]|uniref:hypothetical protein n=3 Tax=Rathayibacter toxicus TaxID=145458 RepID=UPI001CA49F2C
LFTPAMTRNIGSIRPLRHTLHTNIRLTRRHHTMEPYLHKNRILQRRALFHKLRKLRRAIAHEYLLPINRRIHPGQFVTGQHLSYVVATGKTDVDVKYVPLLMRGRGALAGQANSVSEEETIGVEFLRDPVRRGTTLLTLRERHRRPPVTPTGVSDYHRPLGGARKRRTSEKNLAM